MLASSPAHATEPPVPSVPAAGPLVAVGCDPGQTDFNTATAAQISGVLNTVLGGPMRPVAERVVSSRAPWYLDHEDLEVVNGIGPAGARRLKASGLVCFFFDQSGPPPADISGVCRAGDGRIDVNAPESRTALASLFNAKTAGAIVAGIPHAGPQPVMAEHIPGAGKGNPARLRLCATPPTVSLDSGAITWTFAARSAGVAAKSADERSVLTVPADAVPEDRWVRTEDLVATGDIVSTPAWPGDLQAIDPKPWATPTWEHTLLTIGGTRVQPAAPVHLTMAGDENLVSDRSLMAVIVHFADDGSWTASTDREIPGTGGRAGAWLGHLSISLLTYRPRFAQRPDHDQVRRRVFGDEPEIDARPCLRSRRRTAKHNDAPAMA